MVVAGSSQSASVGRVASEIIQGLTFKTDLPRTPRFAAPPTDTQTASLGLLCAAGNGLDVCGGKEGARYRKHSGFCLETQVRAAGAAAAIEKCHLEFRTPPAPFHFARSGICKLLVLIDGAFSRTTRLVRKNLAAY